MLREPLSKRLRARALSESLPKFPCSFGEHSRTLAQPRPPGQPWQTGPVTRVSPARPMPACLTLLLSGFCATALAACGGGGGHREAIGPPLKASVQHRLDSAVARYARSTEGAVPPIHSVHCTTYTGQFRQRKMYLCRVARRGVASYYCAAPVNGTLYTQTQTHRSCLLHMSD